jgi:N6-L-threonylcarbamoyladenine synthase
MLLLAIETSCDETAAAVLEVRESAGAWVRGEGGGAGTALPEAVVLSDVVASQIADHAPYGGVVPELASRKHLTAILPVIRKALAEAGGSLDDIDALAVTAGPGLVGSLLIGIQAAKAIAHARKKPLVGVHHLAAHLLSSHLRRPGATLPPPAFPYLSLVVSGGHTALYRVDGPERIRRLAATRDDAAGEAFDKVGKLLGLAYPGGPAIDEAARGVDPGELRFPRGLERKDTLDFSFSGLKTAVADVVRAHGGQPARDEVRRIAAAFQRSVVSSLVRKSLAACRQTGVRRLTLGGGVAANGGLRAAMAEACVGAGVELFLPVLSDCTDNAAMVGLAALPRLVRGEDDGGALAARSSWELGAPDPACFR